MICSNLLTASLAAVLLSSAPSHGHHLLRDGQLPEGVITSDGSDSIAYIRPKNMPDHPPGSGYLELRAAELDVDVEQSTSSPEIFPLVLGGVLLICSVSFTAFTLWIVLRKRVENQRQEEENDVEDATIGSRWGSGYTALIKDGKDTRNSWVYGRVSSTRASSTADFASVFDKIEEGSTTDEEAIMSWKDLSCSYPAKRSGEADITTLSNVTGHIKYKELVAIMGGSGGGKSTLMDILSGRKTIGTIRGEMSVLGTEISPSSDCKDILRDVAAYVPQNEQFFPNQTPEEAVEFAANLKLGRDERGDHVRKSRVREMLDLVGIPVKARTRPIGGTLAGGVVLRGLSGGERKRLALACAFAMKPKLIFLDEITSGELDSALLCSAPHSIHSLKNNTAIRDTPGLDSENAVVVIDL